MKANNRFYEDIKIDYNTLNILPIQGSIFENLHTWNDIIDEDEDKGGLEQGPTYSDATGLSPANNTFNISEAYASLNANFKVQTENENIV